MKRKEKKEGGREDSGKGGGAGRGRWQQQRVRHLTYMCTASVAHKVLPEKIIKFTISFRFPPQSIDIHNE